MEYQQTPQVIETLKHITEYIDIGAQKYVSGEKQKVNIAVGRITPVIIKNIKELSDEPHESFQEIYDTLNTYMSYKNENISCFGFIMATKLYSLRGRLPPNEPPKGYLLDLMHLFEKTAYDTEENILLREAASNALVSVERKRDERKLNPWHLDPNWRALQKNIEIGKKIKDTETIQTPNIDNYIEKNLEHISKQIN